jgi:hypothetical protein
MFELFKKEDDLDSVEKVLGGIFGLIAIVAAIVEMVLGGFNIDTIVAAIKDISGTAVVVVLLIAFVKRLPKPVKDVRESIEFEMEKVEKSYAPLIRKAEVKETDNVAKKSKLGKTIRYEIAKDVNALFGKESTYIRFFDTQAEKPTEIKFAIRKAFFGDTPENPFAPEQIAEHLKGYVEKKHVDSSFKYAADKDGGFVLVTFDSPVETDKEVEELISIVDDMLFAFVTENKKG